MISFQCGKAKVRIVTKAYTPTPLDNNPLYAKGEHILNGLGDDKMNSCLDDDSTIVPFFEIDILMSVEPYIACLADLEAPNEVDPKLVKELQHACDTCLIKN